MRVSLSGVGLGAWEPFQRGLHGLRSFFAYHGVWAVGVRLLRKLSIRNKILCVLGLVLLPLLPMSAYLVTTQTQAVHAADSSIAGAKLVDAMQDLAQVLWDEARRLESGRSSSFAEVSAAADHLLRVRAEAEANGLVLLEGWEGMEPALARLRNGGALSLEGRLQDLAVTHEALVRLHGALLPAAGFLLTKDKIVLGQSSMAYLYLPQAADELWKLSHAVQQFVWVQSRQGMQLPRLAPQLLVLAGQIQSFESAVGRIQRYEQFAQQGDLKAMPTSDLKALALVLSTLREALADDAQLNEQELIVLRKAQDLANQELHRLKDQYLSGLIVGYQEAARNAKVERAVLLGCTSLSLSLAMYLFYAFFLVMRGGLKSLNENMRRMAIGDLTVRARPLGGDEVAETMRSMSQSVEHLSELLVQVRLGASSVSQAAEQIATGNGELRSRNHSTSDALDKVVDGIARYSSQLEACGVQVERVVGSVQSLRLQSTRNRRQMDELRVMLGRVRNHSQQINEAVSLIDNMAFRTNILALNASVEASKAGEAGKGFAVVAQEVRSLAQRSADTARRIGSLVAASGSHVEQSAHLADDTGQAIAESEAHIDLIHSAMADVAELTRQGQSESGAIMGQVRELSGATEKNLGLVEQLASASYSLRSQGERLMQRLSHFKLG